MLLLLYVNFKIITFVQKDVDLDIPSQILVMSRPGSIPSILIIFNHTWNSVSHALLSPTTHTHTWLGAVSHAEVFDPQMVQHLVKVGMGCGGMTIKIW